MAVIEEDGDRAGPFLLDRFEVTNGQFEAFLGATAHVWTQGDPETWDLAARRLRSPERREYPVVRVTLHDARAYTTWAGKRLPTLLEWVRAANRRDRADYPWGTKSPEQYYTNSLSARLFCPAPVGAFPSGESESGVFDMAGNVWEWTDTVPDYWSEDAPRLRKAVLAYTWFPHLLPGFDTKLDRVHEVLDPGDPVYLSHLLPRFDTRPTRLAQLDMRVPVPYAGSGRIVVGGSFRTRATPNYKASEIAKQVVYEQIERDTLSVQLLVPDEWRDDVGFRCARDIGAREVEQYLKALVRARPVQRDRILRALRAMGKQMVKPYLDRVDFGTDPDLLTDIKKLRDDLNP